MRVIDAVAETPALCEMFHIPVQSGDDDILREMGRGYTANRFKEIVASIRERHAPSSPSPDPRPDPRSDPRPDPSPDPDH